MQKGSNKYYNLLDFDTWFRYLACVLESASNETTHSSYSDLNFKCFKPLVS